MMYFDRQGQPIDLERWVTLQLDATYKRVAFDEVGEATVVSTVWTGLGPADLWLLERVLGGSSQEPTTQSKRPDAPAMIFETMVAGGWAGGSSGSFTRYATEAAAIAGHREILAAIVREQGG